MAAVKGTLKNGTIILDRPAEWPEGARVRVEPIEEEVSVGIRDEDWPTDPEGIAKLLARMDKVEPFEMTPEEEADLAAWRQKVKEYTIANMDKRIEGLFELAMQLTHDLARCVRPPAFLCEADSVLARDYAAPRQYLREKLIECAIHSFAHGCVTIIPVHHHVYVNVAVASMTKTSDLKSMSCLKRTCEFHQIDESAPRHNHILV